MSSVSTIAQWQSEVQEHLPSLSRSQAQVLGLWSYAIVLAKSCGITQVSNWLADALEVPRARLRQRLREWDYEAAAKRGRKRREVRVEDCFAALLCWVTEGWKGEHRMALALDATTLGERFTVLAVSVVYRGCAVPVAWRILRANEPGEWQGPIEALFEQLQGAIPTDWQVIVMVDRGLYAPWLYETIQRMGWHPVLRVKEGMSFRADGEEQASPIGQRVQHRGRKWKGQGVWSEQGTPMEGTLVVRWEGGYAEKLAVVTDLPPEEAEGAWYQMRFWIEDEFKDEKRGGWRWEQTKMTDPERAQRRWLAMAVATHWVVRVGGTQEAGEQEKSRKKPKPGQRKVGRPAKQFHRPRGREISCFVRGQQAISAAVSQGKPMPEGNLVAEPWPTKLYAVGKPPSSWVKKRKHKEERKRQRKSKQAEEKRMQRAERQIKKREERTQEQQAKRTRTKAQHSQEREAERQRCREQRERQREIRCAQRTQEQEHAQQQKREARKQRQVEQEQLRMQRQRWHEECAQARRERQERRQERLARQTPVPSDAAHSELVRQANSP